MQHVRMGSRTACGMRSMRARKTREYIVHNVPEAQLHEGARGTQGMAA